MNKLLLLLSVLGVLGSHSALANGIYGDGDCSKVTGIERNGRGSIHRICFNDNCNLEYGRPETWWYYAGANDKAGEDAGKYFIGKTASPISPINRDISLENTPGKKIVKGDFCIMVKIVPFIYSIIGPNPHVFEKMVCRQDAGTGLNGCSSQFNYGWQSLK
jgi:hypothetical protein